MDDRIHNLLEQAELTVKFKVVWAVVDGIEDPDQREASVDVPSNDSKASHEDPVNTTNLTKHVNESLDCSRVFDHDL